MSTISGPGVYIDLATNPEAVIAGLERTAQAAERAGARIQAAIPARDINGQFAAYQSRVASEVRADADRLASDYSNSVGVNFTSTTKELSAASDGASISIGKLAGQFSLVTATAYGFFEAGRQIRGWLDSIGEKNYNLVGTLDFKKPTTEAERLNAELGLINNKIESAERGSFIDRLNNVKQGDDLADLYKKRQILQGQQDALGKKQDAERAAATQAKDKELADRRKSAQIAELAESLSVVSEREKIERQFVIHREQLTQQYWAEEDAEIRKSIQRRLGLNLQLRDKQLQDIKDRESKEREAAEKKDKDDRDRAEKTAKALADAMDKALAKSLDDFRDGLTEATRKGVEDGLSKVNTTLTNLRQILDIQRNAAGPVVRRLG